jgi:S1-C subfamily serine protease
MIEERKQPATLGQTLLAHGLTVAVTLGLMILLFGDRLGLRPPPPNQIAGAARNQPKPRPNPPAPAGNNSTKPIPTGNRSEASPTSPDLAIPEGSSPPPPQDILKDLDPDERINVRVYAAANKSVVNITAATEGLGFFGDETSTGTGSGFVIDKLGHLLTNFHVIQGASTVRATMFDGSSLEAKVIGADASNDVAVLKIDADAEKLFPVTFGDSSRVMVGQKILALGNPFGLERTLTAGIVSSLDRSLRAKNGRMITGVIQTDAAINPGNSGGPLLNSRGQVIGMNTAIVSQVGQSAGISFAVPINSIARILKPLIQNGRVIRADVGVSRVYSTGEGLLVLSLAEGGPAEQAGIRPIQVKLERLGPGMIRRSLDPSSADLIVAVEHKRVKTVEEFLTEVEKHQPGETIRLTVIRDGEPMDIPVVAGQS